MATKKKQDLWRRVSQNHATLLDFFRDSYKKDYPILHTRLVKLVTSLIVDSYTLGKRDQESLDLLDIKRGGGLYNGR